MTPTDETILQQLQHALTLLEQTQQQLTAIEARFGALEARMNPPHPSRRWFRPQAAAALLGLTLHQLNYARLADPSWREGKHYRQANRPTAKTPRWEYNVEAIESLKSMPAGKRRVG